MPGRFHSAQQNENRAHLFGGRALIHLGGHFTLITLKALNFIEDRMGLQKKSVSREQVQFRVEEARKTEVE